MTAKDKKTITKTTQKLLELLEVNTDIEIADSEDVVDILLKTEETGMLIGYHGETLESLQLILSLCIAKELGKYVRVSLEVGDYKRNREDWLRQTVDRIKEQVLAENRSIALPSLKSWERRFVHMILQDDKEVTSESTGEGRDRTLSISPKANNSSETTL